MRKSISLLPATLLFLALIGVAFFSNQSTIHAEDDHGDYRFTSTSLKIGSGAISGVINPSDILFDVDYFSFQALRGVKYTFVLDEITVVDANISIINSLSRGNNSSPEQVLTVTGGQKTVTWVARTTDTYYVEVSGTINNFDGSFYLGEYTLTGFEDTRFVDRHSDEINGATQISSGNVYQGAISPWSNQPSLLDSVDGGDDSDFFSFQAQRGVRYTVEVDLETSEGVEISIHTGFAGLEKTNDGIGSTINWISPRNSTYYIAVTGTTRVRDSSGTYAIRLKAETALLDRHSQTVAGATVVSFGNAHQGSISPADDLDYFSFPVQRGVRYTLDVSLGSADGVALTIIDTGGTSLASNGGVGTRLEWLSPANGTFLAVISASTQVPNVIGTYSLNLSSDNTLQDHHGDFPGTASVLSFGNAHPGAVSPETDRDYFSFLAERGVNYSVVLDLITANGAVISIENPEGDKLSSTNGLGTGLGWTAASTGLFYVVVSHSPQATQGIGSYALTVSANISLEDRHLDTASAGTPLSFGTVYQGAISPQSDLDFFTFPAQRGVEYLFDLTYGSASSVSLEVNTVGGSADTGARNFGESNIVRWTAPDSATYFVKVSSSAKAAEPTGTYSLKVTPDTTLQDRHSDNPEGGTRIGFGNAIAGAISPANDYDYFRFLAEKGITYTVEVRPGTVEGVRFSLENQAAGFSTSNFGLEQSLEWEAPEAGWYTLAVSASGRVSNPIGTYLITINRQSDTRPETPKVIDPAPDPADVPPPRITGPIGTALILESRVSPLGSTVRVPVKLNQAGSITSLGFSLNYDSDSLRVLTVERGSRITEDSFSYDADTLGEIRFGFAVTKGTGSGGTAAVVEFQVVGTAGSVSPITLSDALVNHNANGPLTMELVGADFKVGPRLLGDADGDSRITALDALQALRMASNLQKIDLSLDVNNDGKITIDDARIILNMARPG
ncbi:MAG: hypothetical protein IH872_03045 [Chloroflexi bacterium]|nr:hypothetical protein [Chloroflexota bacterium]